MKILKNIIKARKKGEDETGSGGFWDYAGKIATELAEYRLITDNDYEFTQQIVYSWLIELVE